MSKQRSGQKEHDTTKVRKTEGFLARKWHFWLVLVFGILLSIGMWGLILWMPTGDDYAFQVTRLQSASRAWANGQLLPQVDPAALGGFGYAYNLFYGPIVTYFVAGVQFLVQNWAVTLNLVLSLLLILSGMTMCWAVTKISRRRTVGALAGIFYMAMPYVLSDYYSRMAVGEITAFAVAPILLWGLYQLTTKQRHATRSIAFAAALLVLTHSLSAAMFALMAAVYVILNIDKLFNIKTIWRMVLAVAVALGLTAFFTLPLVEAKLYGADYGIFDADYAAGYFGANAGSVNDHRLYPTTMLLDVDYVKNGAVLGPVAIIGLVGFWLVRKKIEEKPERRFLTSLWVVALGFLLATTALVDWSIFPQAVLQIQFPWRLLEVVVVIAAVLAAYVVGILLQDLAAEKRRVAVLVAGMLAVMPVTQVFLPNMERHLETEEAWMEIENGSLGWQAEYAPVEMLCSTENTEERDEPYYCSLPKVAKLIVARGEDAKVLRGKASVTDLQKDGLKIELRVKNEANEAAEIELPLVYYPGYEAWLGEEELELRIARETGLVIVVVPAKTQGEVRVSYKVSRATQIGVMVSLATMGSGLIWIIITGIYDMKRRQKDVEVARLMDSVREVIDDDMELMEQDEALAEKKDIVETATQVDEEAPMTKPTQKTRKRVAAKKVMETGETAVASETVKTAKTTGTTKTTRKSRAKKMEEDNATSAQPTNNTTKRATSKTAATKTRNKAEESVAKVTKVKATSRPRKDPE